MRQLGSDRLDRDVEAGGPLLEVLEIRVESGDHPGVLVVEAEDRAVSDHLSVGVAERRIADLAARKAEHVVREDPIGGAQRVRSAEVPLAQRRLVPDADTLANRPVLGDGIAEVVGPEPAFPVHELAPELALGCVEPCVDDLRAHLCSTSSRNPLQPSSDESSAVCSSSGRTAASIASCPKRDARPCTPMIAASSSRLPQTGAAIAGRSSSRSPKL